MHDTAWFFQYMYVTETQKSDLATTENPLLPKCSHFANELKENNSFKRISLPLDSTRIHCYI